MNIKNVERTKVVLQSRSKATPAPSADAAAPSTASSSSQGPPPAAGAAQTTDPLQLAAQIYPWLYMTSTLEKAFGDGEKAAEAEIQTFARDLAQDEESIRDEKTRWESERFIEFCDSLSSTPAGHLHVLQDLPEIMQSYLRHGKEADTWERKALDMAMSQMGTGTIASSNGSEETRTDEDAKDEQDRIEGAYQQQLNDLQSAIDHIEGLVNDGSTLGGRIQDVIDAVSPPAPVAAVPLPSPPPEEDKKFFEPSEEASRAAADGASHPLLTPLQRLLPLLSLRGDNLKLALELVDGAREGASMNLRAVSLGLY
ncbi:hypothetical protein BD626DRAFT_479008 [Schizophyllum amplum]|uniref:Uncharacterized protein n=1 Tax=Schizophyllum amplum TaxID=97359 RepID=A0A550CRW4_9AGAR|nr:hypothetical protein BD626DRAFT_479008 [Auriculariopsis ampla]